MTSRQENLSKQTWVDDVSIEVSEVEETWFHPLLEAKPEVPIKRMDLQDLASDYFNRFQSFFCDQPEGSIVSKVKIEFSRKMKQKLGLAFLFEHKIRLNQDYFATDPRLLPYTLFHELTHIWLYDCLFDPGHTKRFYKKMEQFAVTGLPIDPDVHIHRRAVPEGKHIYSCPNCNNRWYLRDRLQHAIYCGHCYDRHGIEHYALPMMRPKGHPLHEKVEDPDTAA